MILEQHRIGLVGGEQSQQGPATSAVNQVGAAAATHPGREEPLDIREHPAEGRWQGHLVAADRLVARAAERFRGVDSVASSPAPESALAVQHEAGDEQVDQAAVDRVGLDEAARPRVVAAAELLLELLDRRQPLDVPGLHGSRLQRVIEVAHCTRDPVGKGNHLPFQVQRPSRANAFERLGWRPRVGPALEDALAHRIGQIETGMVVAFLDPVDHAQPLPGTPEAADVSEGRSASTVQSA